MLPATRHTKRSPGLWSNTRSGTTRESAQLKIDAIGYCDWASWARLAGSFDYAKAPLVGGRYFLGDYIGMTQTGNSFVVAFGRPDADANNRSDIVTSLARPFPPAVSATVATESDAGASPTAATRAKIDAALRDAVRARRREP